MRAAALVASLALFAPLSALSAEQKAWAGKMKGLQQLFQELLIDLNSDERYESPRNFKRIEKNAEKFAKLAHDLNLKEVPAPDADPTIQIVASQFAQEADQAYKTLKSGHRDYARGKLKSMAVYCMACHTRNDNGLSVQGAAAVPGLQALRSVEKGDFYASTRQFNRALDEYEKVIADAGSVDRRTFDWQRAVRSALSLAVRVKKDPDRALAIIDRVLRTPNAPFYFREQATQWKKSVNDWKAEGVIVPRTEEGHYALAVKLVGEGKSLQKYPADRSADILYLRASSAIHDLLGFAPNGQHVTDALYLAGLCYDVLQDVSLPDQHELYYKACIMRSPHTEKSLLCFDHYERSVYLGYTGSGGTSIPADARKKLDELELISMPADGQKPLQ